MPQIDKVPLLSTGHLTENTYDRLQETEGEELGISIVARYDEGCFVYVGDDNVDETTPEDLAAVFAWAKEQGFYWVRIDRDGDTVEGLQTYEW
jgi:hypothetical protein